MTPEQAEDEFIEKRTVRSLIALLAQLPPDAEFGIAASPAEIMVIASAPYLGDDGRVYIDVETP